MTFMAGLLLGGVVGVVLERILGRPLDRLVIDPCRRAWLRRSLSRASTSARLTNESVTVAGTALFVRQYVPSGIGHDHLTARVETMTTTLEQRHESSQLSHLLPDAEELGASVARWEKALADDARLWNGTSLALYRADVTREASSESAQISLTFREASYATSCALDEAWTQLPIERRRHIDGDVLREVDPLLSNGFGLNCTIETADGLVLLTRRSKLARGWEGYSHISFNEGLSVMDRLPGGAVDLRGAFARGMHEELGISRGQIASFDDRLCIHTLVLDIDRYQWGLLAHLDLRGTEITSAALRMARNLGAAHDDWEAAEVRFIPFTSSARAVLKELSNADRWVPHGLLNLALSAIHRHPSDAVAIRSALLK